MLLIIYPPVYRCWNGELVQKPGFPQPAELLCLWSVRWGGTLGPSDESHGKHILGRDINLGLLKG